MKIENFIKRDFITASAFAGIADLKTLLLEHSAIVIMEEGQYFGVLTALDIVRKQHILAVDCLCVKTQITICEPINSVLFYMKQDGTEVLPVFDKKTIVGLVFKNDILEYLNEHNKKLQTEVEQYAKNLEQKNNEFKEKIQQQKVELESIIEQRTKELIDLVETRDKYIRIIAHELRSPFNSILGFLGLLQKNLRNYDIDKIEKFLTRIYHSATITFDLLVNLLNWLNAKDNKIPFNPEKTCIYKLLSDEILTTLLSAEQKQININNCVPDNVCAFVDRNMVKTIFRNLINNAIKFTETDGEISIFAKQAEQFVEITVKDSGTGITQGIIEKLFKIEGISSLPGTANEKGSGLGLLLCKEFVEIEGGKIWVESTLGQGSEFKFTLPRYIDQNADINNDNIDNVMIINT